MIVVIRVECKITYFLKLKLWARLFIQDGHLALMQFLLQMSSFFSNLKHNYFYHSFPSLLSFTYCVSSVESLLQWLVGLTHSYGIRIHTHEWMPAILHEGSVCPLFGASNDNTRVLYIRPCWHSDGPEGTHIYWGRGMGWWWILLWRSLTESQG